MPVFVHLSVSLKDRRSNKIPVDDTVSEADNIGTSTEHSFLSADGQVMTADDKMCLKLVNREIVRENCSVQMPVTVCEKGTFK